MTLTEIKEAIEAEQKVLVVAMEKQLKGNKAAGQRARKSTNVLTKLYKQFRAISLEQ